MRPVVGCEPDDTFRCWTVEGCIQAQTVIGTESYYDSHCDLAERGRVVLRFTVNLYCGRSGSVELGRKDETRTDSSLNVSTVVENRGLKVS